MNAPGDRAARQGLITTRDLSPDARQAGWLHGALIVILIAAAIALLPALQAEVRQDEAATLLEFSAHGAWYPSTTYILPNNHMLFSAVLALWRTVVDGTVGLRALPALMLGCTSALLYAFGKREFGLAATVCALAFFLGSDLMLGFGLGLRGYPFTWPAALAMAMCAPAYLRSGALGWACGWFVGCAWAIVSVPTNVLLVPVTIVWAFACVRFDHRTPWRQLASRAAGALGLACAPLLVYTAHAGKMARMAQHLSGTWSPGELTAHWLLATGGQIWPLLLVAVAGIVIHARTESLPRAVRRALLWCAVYLAVVPAALSVLPMAPYPRILVPFLPMWCLALGTVVAYGCTRWPLLATAPGLALLATLGFACGKMLPACGGHALERGRGNDLCQQYYRANYHPRALMHEMERRLRGTSATVMLDTEASLAFAVAVGKRVDYPVKVLHFDRWRRLTPAARPSFVVTSGEAELEATLARVTTARPLLAEVAIDSGFFFKLYRLAWPAAASRPE